MKKYFLTIDNGGTNTKSVIFDIEGNQINSVSFPTMRIEDKSGYHEIDLHVLWKAIAQSIKEVIKQSNINRADIIGVSCVGHGKGLYMLDRGKNIFTHGILSTDSRASSMTVEFENKINDIFSITHQHVMESQAPILLSWLKKNNPNIYSNIGFVLSAKDFVRFKLTDSLNQEYGDASSNNLLNIESCDYDSRIFDFFNIKEMTDKMPDLLQFDALAGRITAESSVMTGLSEGTPVFGGMFDIDACAIATGVINEDFFSVIAGTWNINTFPSNEFVNRNQKLMSSIYPTGSNLIEASSPTSAGNLSIMLKMLMNNEIDNAKEDGRNIYEILEEFLIHTDATFSKVLFFPFLYGSNTDKDAEGTFLGIQSNTTKSEMIRAVYEGITFAHKQHVDQLVDFLGHKPKAIRISGGATNSNSWMAMFANVLNIPVQVVSGTEIGGLGGAIVSALGCGIYKDLNEAVNCMVHLEKEFVPSDDQVLIYEKKYETFLAFINSMQNTWSYLKTMQKEMEKK
ncbi:FGGY-family carbohydrate kinase [Leuconostoc carnosum]|uniref:FGGY-family carbohydrate kinase n=1 Tax=Leuconostoc carnosum TaxID=1252 RepID=UPI00123AC961|nr:FGGY-family carbohydrate kinase [Leuconostoc carnosum]KAA8328297.1 carbohydrate kinase [Leuconostoc carnosum]